MSVSRFGVESFIENQVEKIRKIKAVCGRKGCQPLDRGGRRRLPANAYKVIDAGASALVAGSADLQLGRLRRRHRRHQGVQGAQVMRKITETRGEGDTKLGSGAREGERVSLEGE